MTKKGGPSARFYFAMTSFTDPSDNQVKAFMSSGIDGLGTGLLSDAYIFDGIKETWTTVKMPNPRFPPRYGLGLEAVKVSPNPNMTETATNAAAVVLFGGTNSANLNDTWIYCVGGPQYCAITAKNSAPDDHWARFDSQEDGEGDTRLLLLARFGMTMSSITTNQERAVVFGGRSITFIAAKRRTFSTHTQHRSEGTSRLALFLSLQGTAIPGTS